MPSTEFLLCAVFIVGYVLIVFEHAVKINKAASALLLGTVAWGVYFYLDASLPKEKQQLLGEHSAEISQILFFLLGAMSIVEMIAEHRGFDFLRDVVPATSARVLFWILLILSFFLSAVLDNLTTILVMVAIVRKLADDKALRRLLCAGLIFSVNAGGAWSPIGDVTTTMLWIGDRINAVPIITTLFLPSFFSVLVFGVLFSTILPKAKLHRIEEERASRHPGMRMVLFLGLAGLISVPAVKAIFHLPPFMGIMFALSVLWLATDLRHHGHKERDDLRIPRILSKIEMPCILFFLGILLGVAALQAAGILSTLAEVASAHIPNIHVFNLIIGVVSAIIDNVPLVAAVMSMYDLSVYPTDHIFWDQLSYCAGVGGSLLIIGSAPGVAVMSLADIGFFWYLKKVSWIVAISYFAGWGMIVLMSSV